MVLDTDTYNEIDDQFAVALVIERTPEVERHLAQQVPPLSQVQFDVHDLLSRKRRQRVGQVVARVRLRGGLRGRRAAAGQYRHGHEYQSRRRQASERSA